MASVKDNTAEKNDDCSSKSIIFRPTPSISGSLQVPDIGLFDSGLNSRWFHTTGYGATDVIISGRTMGLSSQEEDPSSL